jgi:hypothetical protein
MPDYLQTRICKNNDCQLSFIVKRYDPKVFCSKSCAVHSNNIGRKLSRTTKLKIANSLSSVPITVLKSEISRKVAIKKILDSFNISSDELRGLYIEDKLSSGDIAREFGVSIHRVMKRLKKYKIPRRSSIESNHLRFLRKPPSFNLKTDLNEEEKLLYNSAVMLYWGEGAKAPPGTGVKFANSDENMALLFLKALREVFRIDESRLRIGLYCYANQNPERLKRYWSELLKVPLNKFIKPYVRYDFNPNKKGKMPHGVVYINYSDKKLWMKIMSEIDIISRRVHIG